MERLNNEQKIYLNNRFETEKPQPEMTLSIVVPTIGKSSHLYSSFHSIFEQSSLPDEIVIVWNGCSAPDWFACVERTAKALRVPIVQVSHKQQVDIALSWSSGASAVTSALLFFLGDDDLIDPDFISLAREIFRTQQGLDVFSTNAKYIDNDGTLLGINFKSESFQYSSTVMHYVNKGSAWFASPPAIFSSVFRSQKLEAIGFFPYLGFAFDVWMFHHLAMADGYYLSYVHLPKISYRRSPSSASNQIMKHALDYITALIEFQNFFYLHGQMKSFRVIAANFALTAIAKSQAKPMSIVCFGAKIFQKGFMPDLAHAFFLRLAIKLKQSLKHCQSL
jgi:glycosyltransferase involved in cell wall biosynthesis